MHATENIYFSPRIIDTTYNPFFLTLTQGARKKKLAFLAEGLDPPPLSLAEQGILYRFFSSFLCRIIYMIWKPANSDTENGMKKNRKMSPEKKIMYSGNGKNG